MCARHRSAYWQNRSTAASNATHRTGARAAVAWACAPLHSIMPRSRRLGCRHYHLLLYYMCTWLWQSFALGARWTSIKSSAIVNSCQVLKKVFFYTLYITKVLTTRYLRSFYLAAAQFSSVPPFWSIYVFVTLDARGCLAWTSLGIILFLRSLYYKVKLYTSGYSGQRGLFAIRPTLYSKFSSVLWLWLGYYFLSSIIIYMLVKL